MGVQSLKLLLLVALVAIFFFNSHGDEYSVNIGDLLHESEMNVEGETYRIQNGVLEFSTKDIRSFE